MVSQVR